MPRTILEELKFAILIALHPSEFELILVFVRMITASFLQLILLICVAKRRAIFHLLNRLSVIGHLRTSDDNDLEHVMNTDSSLETGPFGTFRPPQHFIIYLNFSFTFSEGELQKQKKIRIKEFWLFINSCME